MKNFTSFFVMEKSKSGNFKHFSIALMLLLGMGGSVFAQTITFTGNTTDFTTPGITALSSATGNVTYYASTDGTYMYFGAFRNGGNTWGSTDHFTVYVDADPRSAPTTAGNGSTTGLSWDNQTPTMPFRADYRIAVRTDGNTGSGSGSSFYSSNNTTSGTANWSTGGANAKGYTQYVSNSSNGGMEIRVPLSDFGNPASTYISMFSSFSGGGGGFFAPAAGTFTGSSLNGYLRNLGVYKTSGNLTAGAVSTAITDLSVTSNSTVSGDYGDISVTGASIIWTLAGNSSFSGTMTVGAANSSRVNLVSSSNTLFVGGRGVGGSAGTIAINSSSGNPIYSGTSSGGGVTFLGNGLVNGTGTRMFGNTSQAVSIGIGGAVDFTGGSGTTTLFGGGNLTINLGGSVSNPLTYQTGTTLIYNTGTTYTASTEWTPNVTSGVGYPDKVTIQGNTSLNFGSSAQYRQASGDITIGSGSSLTLSSVAGGDIRFQGNFTNSGTFNTNGRALYWAGTSAKTYTKTGGGTDTIDIFIHNSTSALNLAASPNATNWTLVSTGTTTASALQLQSSGALYLDANTLTIPSGGTIYVTGAGSITGLAPSTPGIINFAGVGNVTPVTSGTSTVTTNVNTRVQTGGQLVIGGNATTPALTVAGVFQLNQGGYVDNAAQAVKYSSGSTLIYNNTSGAYGVQNTEWPSTNSPTNVTVGGTGSGITFATNNIGSKTIAGTLTLNQNLSLTGSGPAALTTLNTVANATATVSGTGNFTHSALGSFTTANTSGINGTLTTSGTITLPTTTSFTFNNATSSQVTGALLPATIAALTINNPTASTGTAISNNTLTISGVTTLTAGALVLPTGAGNLVNFTGNLTTFSGGGTITGSTTSNISTGGTLTTPANGLTFTSGSANIRNWTHTSANLGAAAGGINSVVNIYGAFTTTTNSASIYVGATGGFIFTSGSSFSDTGLGAGSSPSFAQTTATGGSFTLQSGATFTTGNPNGLNATAASGAVQTTNRTFSGGANYTFTNASAAQNIGDAIDGAGGTGKTGPVTGNIVIANNFSPGVTLNAGTTITVNTPGTFTLGTGTSSAILTAPATSVINGTGAVIMLGNGATNGSTLLTANPLGINGTIQTTGANSLTNGANNNTNFSFNGSAVQVTGALLPAIINNLTISNSTGSATPTADVTLSSSVTVNGSFTNAGRLGIASNTLTLNGSAVFTANKLVPTASSNLIIGGSGTLTATSPFVAGGVSINNFTMNRASTTFTVNSAMTVGGTFSTSNGIVSLGAGLILNGNIVFGSGTITGGGSPLTIGGSGTITGNITATSTPLALTTITMNRSGATLPLGSNVTVSNATGLTLTAGNISLGTFNLTSTSSTGQLGAGSTSSMIVATGSGQAFNTVPTTGFIAQTWPVGDGTNYTPVTLTFTANATGGTVGVKTVASTHPSINTGSTPAAYISRYWTFTNTLGATYTYSGTFRYISPGDVSGTETDLKLSRWNGAAWTEFAGSSVSSPVLSSGSLTQATGPLTGNDYTGRANSASINYVWNGTTNDWNTAANWSPNGVPAAVDNVTIDGTSAVLCSINSGTYTVNNFTLNGTGTFAMVSGTTLTINGNLTYGGSATASLDCASTLNVASAASQTVPALNYGNINLTGGARVLASSGTIGICGTFTPGAGGFTTTGSTINFNGSGSQTIPVFNYNNLTSSSTGARTLAAGVVGVDGIFTPGSNSYTITGNTINFSNAGSQTIPAFNYNAITNTGNGARTLANSGTVAIAGGFTPGSGSYTVTGSTIDYNGTSGFTMTTFTYNNLIISGNKGAGTVSFGSGTITIGGSLTLSATNYTQSGGTSTVVYNGAGAQTITAANYNNLAISGSRGANNVTLANSGTIVIGGTFSPTATFTAGNGYVNTGSSVTFSATNTIPLLTLPTGQTAHFNNLNITAGTQTLAGSLIVGGNLTLTGGTYNATSGSNAYFTTVNGNVNLGAGVIDWAPTGTTVAGTINLKGNLVHTGGTGATTQTVTSINLGGFIFNGTGTSLSPQLLTLANRLNSTSYTVNGGTYVSLTGNTFLWGNATVSQQCRFVVNGSLNVGTYVITCSTANANFIVNAGGTIITANTNGLTTSISSTNILQTFDPAANYEFATSAAAQTANFPTAVTTMNNLTINNSAFDVKTNKSITINGSLTFINGNFDLNGSNNVTLGTSGSIASESASARLINTGSPSVTNGYIGTTRTLSSNPGNVGNIGLNISAASAMGSTVIKRFPKTVTGIQTSLNSISRVYSIQPATPSAGSTISLSYFDSELNGNTETAPSLVTFNSTGANETVAAGYNFAGASATNATANTVTFNAANLTTTNTFWTALNAAKYTTAQNGNWNVGTTWTGGSVPPANSDITINHSVTITADPLAVNSLVINSGKSLLISSGKDLTVTGVIDNEGFLTVENNANLIQVNDIANTGLGNTIVKRNTAGLMRFDYVLWSSPVDGQQLLAFSPSTLTNRFYTFDGTLGTAGQYVAETATNNFVTGKGFLIRMPWDHPTAPTVWNGTFSGGLAYNGTLNITGLPTGKYYATGNPYPSTIDADEFISKNNIGDNPATPGDGIYFWRKTNNLLQTTNPTASYATYTTAGGVKSGGDTLNIIPNGIIQVGEGFIVKVPATSLVFENKQRLGDNSNQFLKTTNTVERHRIWLNLADSVSDVNQMMVSYMTGATQDIDAAIDGRYINDNPTAINSLLNDEEFAIQGRSLPFMPSDVVPLAFKAANAGNYTISLDHADGLFEDGSQAIFLKDNLTNTEHNLNTGAYSFATTAGTFNNRFEIVYESQLGTENPTFTASNVIIYSQDNDFVVNSGNTIMKSIKIFDIRGRLIQEKTNIDANQTTINAGLSNEVLLIQITSEDGAVVTKKVIH